MKFEVITSALEDGSEVAALVIETEHSFLPIWSAPTLSTAHNAEHMFNLVATRLQECGSDREVYALLHKLQGALQ